MNLLGILMLIWAKFLPKCYIGPPVWRYIAYTCGFPFATFGPTVWRYVEYMCGFPFATFGPPVWRYVEYMCDFPFATFGPPVWRYVEYMCGFPFATFVRWGIALLCVTSTGTCVLPSPLLPMLKSLCFLLGNTEGSCALELCNTERPLRINGGCRWFNGGLVRQQVMLVGSRRKLMRGFGLQHAESHVS